jgi:predicted N-formylglutamate amidohydrolase
MNDFPPVETIDGDPASGLLFLCDHASNALPPEYGGLGLPAEAFGRHIAYDIGAAPLTRRLAARFRAPAVLTTWSRLLLDPNRGRDDPTLVMQLSDGQIVPGNHRVSAEEIERRLVRFYDRYDDAIVAALDRFAESCETPIVVSTHTYTPAWKGQPRPWHAGILWDTDPRVARPLLKGLRAEPGLIIGDNEPYTGALRGDTIWRHATRRGLPCALVEVRQDLVGDGEGVAEWADRLAPILAVCAADPEIRSVEYWGSRTGPTPPWP